jgi:hypothetical protein
MRRDTELEVDLGHECEVVLRGSAEKHRCIHVQMDHSGVEANTSRVNFVTTVIKCSDYSPALRHPLAQPSRAHAPLTIGSQPASLSLNITNMKCRRIAQS